MTDAMGNTINRGDTVQTFEFESETITGLVTGIHENPLSIVRLDTGVVELDNGMLFTPGCLRVIESASERK